MAPTNGYTSTGTLKTRLGIGDATDDALLDAIITQVSREIDGECKRRFYAATDTRYYTPETYDLLQVDDLLSVTTLKTDEDGDGVFEATWATTDYVLEPLNAPAESQPEPYTTIRVARNGARVFPGYFPALIGWPPPVTYPRSSAGLAVRSVQVVGSFGYASTTPPVVEAACLFQCALEYMAKDAPSGSAGGGEMETTLRTIGLHPFARRMLEPLRRLVAA